MKNPEALKQAMRQGGVKARVTTLAELLKCTRVTAGHKLNGSVPFKDFEIAELAEYFGWTPEEVYRLFIER